MVTRKCARQWFEYIKVRLEWIYIAFFQVDATVAAMTHEKREQEKSKATVNKVNIITFYYLASSGVKMKGIVC